MIKFNFDREWKFIVNEIHKEIPSKNNLLKRELLFILQILLTKTSNDFRKSIYMKSKKYYLSL